MKKLILPALFLLLASVVVASHAEAQLGLFSSSLKKGEVYRALDGDTLRVASKDEVEDEHGLVAKYSIEGDKVRVVATALGTTKAFYYKITKEGLEEEKGRKILYSSANYEVAKRKADEARQKAELQARMEKEKQENAEREKRAREERNRSLMEASRKGDTHQVKDLLAKGVDVNYSNYWGGHGCNTPLIYASENNHVEIVKLLLDKDANVNIQACSSAEKGKEKYGPTALMQASDKGNLDVVQLLLAKNPDVNIKDVVAFNTCATALMCASTENTEIVNLLLEKGADVNARNGFGDTALIYSVRSFKPAIARLLVAKGADKSTRNNLGATALDYTKPPPAYPGFIHPRDFKKDEAREIAEILGK